MNRPVRRLAVLAALIVAGAALGLAFGPGPGLVSAAAAQGRDAAKPRVRLVTSMGAIVLELDAARAPRTVENFLSYVRSGHYAGTIFHRVIRGFMIQGGGFTPKFDKKPVRAPIPNEADNGLTNAAGTIAMARTSDPHSATAQFFINTVNNANLDHTAKTLRGWGYAVFGRVVAGMDVVRRIEDTPTRPVGPFRDAPARAVVIERVEILAP